MPDPGALVHSKSEFVRYVINGIVATTVHYALLRIQMDFLNYNSAASANLVAAFCAVIVSFIGSRWFVFRKQEDPILRQARNFGLLYGSIVVMHSMFLGLWTDYWRFDYRVGFAIALVFQVIGSFFGNKYLVF